MINALLPGAGLVLRNRFVIGLLSLGGNLAACLVMVTPVLAVGDGRVFQGLWLALAGALQAAWRPCVGAPRQRRFSRRNTLAVAAQRALCRDLDTACKCRPCVATRPASGCRELLLRCAELADRTDLRRRAQRN